MSYKTKFTAEATCRCTACGETFTTSANPENGDIMFDGVREHGEESHHGSLWNYEVVGRP